MNTDDDQKDLITRTAKDFDRVLTLNEHRNKLDATNELKIDSSSNYQPSSDKDNSNSFYDNQISKTVQSNDNSTALVNARTAHATYGCGAIDDSSSMLEPVVKAVPIPFETTRKINKRISIGEDARRDAIDKENDEDIIQLSPDVIKP